MTTRAPAVLKSAQKELAAKKMTIQTFENFQVKMLQIGFCLYRADENAKRLVNIDSHFEQLLIAIMYKCVCISIPD